jgi:hypothetical protein
MIPRILDAECLGGHCAGHSSGLGEWAAIVAGADVKARG